MLETFADIGSTLAITLALCFTAALSSWRISQLEKRIEVLERERLHR